MIGGLIMIEQEELACIRTHFDFWDKLSDSEKNMVENNILKVSYNMGFNLHSIDSECLGVLLIKSGGLRV